MKYEGSKLRLAKKLLPHIERTNEPWVEPFVGGCGMLRHIKGERYAGDGNEYVIALWKAVQNGWVPPKEVSREFWYEVKENYENYPPELVGYVGIGASFCGFWFAAYAGPVGKRDYVAESYRAVLKLAPLIRDVNFVHSTYDQLKIKPGSIIYCDPPYENTRCYYKVEFDRSSFWEWCREKVREGNKVYISEYSAPPDFRNILSVERVSSAGLPPADGNPIEKLFTYDA